MYQAKISKLCHLKFKTAFFLKFAWCMTAGMYLANFTTNAMPSIEEYCRKRYGAEWERYEREVPYQLIPGIY